MNILVIVDDYIPHSIKAGAKMMHELSVELVSRGHVVTVVTPGIDLKTNNEVSEYDGVIIYYFRSGKLKNINHGLRFINELLLSIRAWVFLNKILLKSSINLVIYYSPSIFWSFFIKKLKKIFRCRSFLILRDIFPQWVIDNGIIKKWSPIAFYLKLFEKLNYRYADIIALQSPKNLEWFNRKHNKKNKKNTIVLYNWAKYMPVRSEGIFRKKYNLEEKIIFFYGGNIGHAQDISNLMRLAERFKNYENAVFIFIGIGDEVDIVKEKSKYNKNILYFEPVNQNHFNLILSEIDIGLFSLNYYHKTHNFPGKLLGYMVQNIPILGSVNPGNDVINIIEMYNAGFVSINGEDEIFYNNAFKLFTDYKLRKKMGMNAGRLLNEIFFVKKAADIITINT